jgi:hypothetical protein
MVSFSQIVKYLNIGKGRKTTLNENVDTTREKYDHIVPARRIVKVHQTIIIPTYNDVTWPGFPHNSIIAQFNFENLTAFRLTNIDLLRAENYGPTVGKYLESCFLTVKWREQDTEVHRFHLFGTRQEDNNGNLIVTLFPLYNGEIIGRYAVFELWQGIAPIGYGSGGILNDITLETNILVDPENGDQTEVVLTSPTQYDRASLTYPVGEGPFTANATVQEQGMINQAYKDATI